MPGNWSFSFKVEKGHSDNPSQTRKESSEDVSKFRTISLINTAAKVLEKLFINRIMHHINKTSKLNKNQFGFRPQTSTVDAIMTVKYFLEENLRNKNSVALISLDVQGAFDSAW